MAIEAIGNFQLKRGNGASPEVFSVLAGIKSFDGPATELSFIETTDFDSTDRTREYRPGLKDVSAINMTLNFEPDSAGHEQMVDDHDESTLVNWKLRLVDGATDKIWSFAAYIGAISPKAEVDGVWEAQVTLRVTGPINRDAT